MKFTVRPSALASALSLVGRATSPKSTLPVLGNVLLTVKGDRLSLLTTNLEIALTHWIHVDDARDGSITVPVRLLSEYVALIRGDTLEAELGEHQTLHLEAHGTKTDIKGIAADEFPVLPDVEPQSTLQIPSALLLETISQTAFACAVTDTRPVLSGVFFDVEADNVKVVATDSYRLAKKTLPLLTTTTPVGFIVPSRTIAELGRILPRYEESVTIHVARNQVLFELSDLKLVSRLIEGQFPPYEQIIPSASVTTARVEVEELLTAARRSSLFVRESVNSVRFTFDPSKGRIQLTALSDAVGGETAELPAKVEGEHIDIAFNSQYLIDALANMGATEIVFSLQSPERPGVLRPAENDDYVHVVMPLKI